MADYKIANYPGATSQTLSKNILFNDPCKNPFNFKRTVQIDPSDYAYEGTLEFTLNKFTIDPIICTVSYACTDVRRDDGKDAIPGAALQCSDFTIDFNYDGSVDADGKVTDGKLTFKATGDDYTNDRVFPGRYIVTI